MEELSERWKASVIVHIYKKGDCSNYQGVSVLSSTYSIFSDTVLSRLTPHAEEIIGGHQCGFRRSRSNTYHIICIRQIP
jgi:hypothetical protein